MKRTKIVMICAAVLASVSLISLTACGSNEEAVSSTAESNVISETSASLGIYVQDTDNDGTLDKVVDRYGADLSELYTLKENGIYEGESLVLPLEQTEAFVPVTEIAFTVMEKTVHPESSFALDLVITPENATTKEFELTTDNAEILKIENGNITALANGEATVTATAKAGGATATCKIIVNSKAEESETQNEETATSGGNTTANANNNTQTTLNNNKPTGNTNTGGGGSTNTTPPAQPQTPTQPETPAQPQPTVHAPIYRQQYVVDTPAWTEEVPIWGNKTVYVGNQSGTVITSDPNEYLLNNNNGDTGWHSEVIPVQTGTKTIYHEEKGH